MNNKSRHSGARRNLHPLIKKIPTFAGAVVLLLLCAPAHAQDIQKPERGIALPEDAQITPPENTIEVTPEANPVVTIKPPNCDFEVTFPSEPYSSKRCPDGAGGKCYDLTRYTMVYEMSTTVDVRFSCNPLSPNQYNQYDEQVTRMALNGMAARNNVRESTTNFSQENAIKRTTLSGTGISGRQNKIYVAQIWLSQQSILTMEAELIGPEHGQADAVFGEILKSVQVKQPDTPAEEENTIPAPAPEPVSP